YVKDASRSIGVVSRLLSRDASEHDRIKQENAQIRARHAGRERKESLLDVETARRNAFATDWRANPPAVPRYTGRRVFDIPLANLREYIDWTPFFHAWGMKASYPG